MRYNEIKDHMQQLDKIDQGARMQMARCKTLERKIETAKNAREKAELKKEFQQSITRLNVWLALMQQEFAEFGIEV
jgi:F0F1-type ATP synthase epsilon subunit